MLVAILHNAVADDAPADERDVLVQAACVADALGRLGHGSVLVPVTLDLESLRRSLAELRPGVAFNLVESLGGTDRLCAAVPALLESLGLPFTGGGGDALYVTTSKRLTKERLAAKGLPTPAASFGEDGTLVGADAWRPGRFLVKAVHEHASFGMDDGSVFEASTLAQLQAAVREQAERFGKPFFAEAFVDGREFNLSVLDLGDGSPEVLPPAEITFDAFPPGKPRIVGYAAKWDEGSFEYNQTPRRFDYPTEDGPLLADLTNLAAKTWSALGLRGYARIDFRVDEAGTPWIIEANANPCLSPDAGFAAALERAGIGFDEAVRRIVAAAVAGR